MIKKLEIAGVHMEVGKELKRHVVHKIGHLDKYTPHHARASLHAEVKLKEGKGKGQTFTCEVIIYLPSEQLTVAETTDNIFGAVNSAEEKLKAQLHKYKDLHASPKLRQRLLARLGYSEKQ